MAEPLSPPRSCDRHLTERVVEVVRRHWNAPRKVERYSRPPKEKVEELARAALDTMLTRQYRVGPLPPPEVYDQLLLKVRKKVRKGRPIRIVLGYGPMKNQNAVPYSRADWAEFFALCHLVNWHNKVQAVYPPGLEIRIIFDDSTIRMANRGDPKLMRSYMNSVAEMIQALGFGSIFLRTFRQSTLAWGMYLGLWQFADWMVRRWERDPANKAQLEKMNEYARRNVVVPPGLSAEEREKYILEASHRYRVYWEALQWSLFTKGNFRIIAMYLDGSQHHIRETCALHLTTLDKGQITQPWQGQGCLMDNGHGKLEPFVLTAGRQACHRLQTVTGLNLVPLPGFDSIQIATRIPSEGPPRSPGPE
ncbi:MAG: L-tyrosine/L-tryptophan isonitrile synthase family protein [Gemmataceae bacterium]|nr:L-tyrosine/L-tryptophan isonitrile synthase family protein [Gemmataceae bacterium]MDW8267392.1 L-tyrosine/L-tryptophan isonitrile synthase family protein [Gemmataceae bacterium]